MLKKMMLAAVAVLMLAACGSKETQVCADFGNNAPDRVRVTVGDKIDTTVPVIDGKFEIEVPVDLTTMAHARAGSSVYSFVSDGSKITLDPKDGKAYSNKKGVHSRYVEYTKWMDDFLAAYRKEVEALGDDQDAADALFKERQAEYIEFHKETIKANKDNILGLTALRQIENDDAKEMLSLINSFSSGMRKLPELVELKKSYEEDLK